MSRVQGKPSASNAGRTWLIYGSLAIVVIGIIVAVALSSKTPNVAMPPPAKLTVGQPAPEFSVATDQGYFDLAKAQGQPVFLEVFATWCPHCQREVKTLNRLYATYKDKVHFVAVSGNPLGMDGTNPESQADVMAFVQRLGVQYPVAFDPDLDVAKKYMQSGYPALIVIDGHGKISSIDQGEQSFEALSKAIKAAMKG